MEFLQVRFHPLYPEIVASGSLDHEVRLWDANTSECIGSRDFCNFNTQCHLYASDIRIFCFLVFIYLLLHFIVFSIYAYVTILIVKMFAWYVLLIDRPIASIAFHAKGELLAVASGHKVLIVTIQSSCVGLLCLMLVVFIILWYSSILGLYFWISWSYWLTYASVSVIHMALQQERGAFLTNNYIEDTAFTSSCSFSSTCCTISFNR